MNSRDTILQSVRESLVDLKPRPGIPPEPDVWTVQGKSPDELRETFHASLESVLGEFVPCSNFDDAHQKIASLLSEVAAKKIGVLDRPLSRQIAESLPDTLEKNFSPDSPDEVRSETLAGWDAAIVSPEFLLADTGSCLFFAPTAFDRLLCYITPLCLVVASKSMLREHLPHVWTELKERFGSETTIQRQTEAQTTGEFLIMTGPSRTADIEKVLILGVHGPRRVVVFLLEE
ncbi:MAG: lactate utilization protein [Planctomycetaceae bacterium]|nr:lactate utilization protein [Planctomycetaceae bacterium]